MGHASLITTDTVYSHLYPSDYSAEIAQFESLTADSSSNSPLAQYPWES